MKRIKRVKVATNKRKQKRGKLVICRSDHGLFEC